ncbi:MAG: hypothetical protein N3A38_01665 [Planctomycetota bacterium]|nr:hypothetical protein [Planctomycetota bacterium]
MRRAGNITEWGRAVPAGLLIRAGMAAGGIPPARGALPTGGTAYAPGQSAALPRPPAARLVLAAAALAAAGCMEISYYVNLKVDGSGRVVETLVYGPKLIRLAEQVEGGKEELAKLTSRDRALERAKEMGKGVTLAEFKVEDTPDGGKKLTAAYSFEDINHIALCPYPATKKWQGARLRFSYWVSRDPKRRLMHFEAYQTNWGNDDSTIDGPLDPISETELQKVRRLLPVFKDMLEGFKLSVVFQFETPDQWATLTRGVAPSGHLNPISLSAGKVVVLDLDGRDLAACEDALMIVAPWRQEGAERKLERVLRFPVHWGGFYSKCRRQWAYIQYADRREYY